MEKYYKITGAKRLDGQDNYGNVTDSIYLEGESESALFKHAPTTHVEPGVQIYGVIETLPAKSGKMYRKFSKKSPPEDSDPGFVQPAGSGFASKSNQGDGARQGMAINNAAAYVTAMSTQELSPQDFGAKVAKYAKAVYNVDLTEKDTTQEDILDIMS